MMPAREQRKVVMALDSVAFVSGDVSQSDTVFRALRRVVGQVAVLDSIRRLEDYSPFDLVAVHYDTLPHEEQAELISAFVPRIRPPILLLLSEECAQREMAKLFVSRALTNVLVINDSGVDVTDLLVTVQKVRRREIFGIEKYFGWGLEPRSLFITSSTEKGAALGEITDYAAALGIPPRLCACIRGVADEFLSNAIYNAPVTPEGKPRFRDRPRTMAAHLNPGEEVELRYCCDGRRFGLSAVDPFGALAPNQIRDYLAKGFRGGPDQVSEGSGGAGLGFFQILDSLSHFVVNLDPGKKTEMLGLLDVSGGYRNFARSAKSFNVFVRWD